MSAVHDENMKNLTLAAWYLSMVIQDYESNYDQFQESSLRFRHGTFVEIDSKAMEAGLSELNHTLFQAITLLEAILKELENCKSDKTLPPKKTLAAVYVVIGGVVAAAKELPNVGRIWRWHPDFHAYRHAMEPIDMDGLGSKVDSMFQYLDKTLEVAED